MNSEKKLVAVEVIAIMEERLNRNPFVLLLDRINNRILPILIGETEANAIIIGLYKIETPRPLTHRMIKNLLSGINIQLQDVVIHTLKNNIFFAELHLRQQDNKIALIDARPSDAIALSLESNTPLFVSEEVMSEAGQENPFTEEMLAKFLHNITEEFMGGRKRTPPTPPSFTESELETLKGLLEKARQREENDHGKK